MKIKSDLAAFKGTAVWATAPRKNLPVIGRSSIALSWWESGQLANLGDMITPWLVNHALGLKPVRVFSATPRKLVAIGSIAPFIRPGDWVWGTGTNENKPINAVGARVFGVRGPRTARLLRSTSVPPNYGDPASLLPEFLPRDPAFACRAKVVVVPHYIDYARVVEEHGLDPGVAIIDVTRTDWMANVQAIAAAEIVVSSSLHGIIVAEAYGVPAVWTRISEGITGGEHKFLDWYEGSNRSPSVHEWEIGLQNLVEKGRLSPPSSLGGLRAGLKELRRACSLS